MTDPKNLRVTVSAGQYEKLKEVKADRTWREAILEEFGVREDTNE